MFRNKSTIIGLSVALVVALAVICYLIYKPSYIQPLPVVHVPSPAQGPPRGAPQGPQPVVVLFYAEWCGHSKNMMPAWKEAAQEIQQHGIKVIELEQGQNKDEVQKSNLSGFPTIRLYLQGYPNTNFIKYSGDRSAGSIVKFVQTGGQA